MIEALLGRVAGVSTTYIEDVFSTYLYTGNGTSQTITNGIDLAGKGGMVWLKTRSAVGGGALFDTARGATKILRTHVTDAQSTVTDTLTSFTGTGFSLGADAGNWGVNNLGTAPYYQVGWTFRKAPKFFDVVTFTQSGTTGFQTVSHNLGASPGMIVIKTTGASDNWYVYHRSSASSGLLLNSTAAGDGMVVCQNVTSTSFDFNLTNRGYGNGQGYVAYLFAHDTSADGLIQCGSFTTDGSSNCSVNLGIEPQFLMFKAASTTSQWVMLDNMRGFTASTGAQAYLYANLSNAEATGQSPMQVTATGFQNTAGAGLSASQTYIYLAIRRGPMKPPTSGTQVYNAIARTGTGAAATVTGVGFPPDLILGQPRSVGSHAIWMDKLRGPFNWLASTLTSAEQNYADTISSFNMDGYSVGADATGAYNYSGRSVINYFFRRYPGVFEIFADTGTGSNKTEAHNLTVAPKFWFRKGRSGATQWVFGSTLLAATEKIVSPSPAGKVTDATAWNSTYPTATAFSVGTAAATNTSSTTYITYLVGELAGISKVFGYTGNGSNQTIDCSFAAGARLVLIVRTDAAGSFYIFDTVRGIVAGNDPALRLDTTAAEVTTVDALDPAASGFIVNQEATFNLNILNATYIGFALS